MTDLPLWLPFRSLSTRLVLMLSLALLPLGLISLYQTRQVVLEREHLAEGDLLWRTQKAASIEEGLIRTGIGAAKALGHAALAAGQTGPVCQEAMRSFLDANPDYVFAGFTQTSGEMNCGPSTATANFSQADGWQKFLTDPQPTIVVRDEGRLSGQAVIIISEPVFRAGQLMGLSSISLPQSIADDALISETGDALDLLLFTPDGTVITTTRAVGEDPAPLLPSDRTLSELFGTGGGTFVAPDGTGQQRRFALVPLIAGQVNVLGSVPSPLTIPGYLQRTLGFGLFPVLMWFASMFVAVFAVNRLVLRHLFRLKRRMALFGAGDTANAHAELVAAPQELDEIAQTYNRMVDQISADAAAREANLAEKEMLIREVHHRVKNNLQLMASILNMQIRTARTDEGRKLLRRVLDRVMSLAAIHRNLYTSSQLSTVPVHTLLAEVANSVLAIGIPPSSEVEIDTRYDPVSLDPDQAMPLALLANEAITNATKYLGRPADGPPKVKVALLDLGAGRVQLDVENSKGTAIAGVERDEGTGLGQRLIEAFVSQLGGTLELEDKADIYRIHVTFQALTPKDHGRLAA
ncbi:MAG: histidine kinase dimerization/phosphoacceptor domain -containing protein [Pseudomonadota bacterium]